ncbi:hypothetical protein [Vibrio sp. McD22-P3]|uniref:hypothetical protein n=1 Tax=Vibrio sp. McD22-P3 TaxID=2724880 RepID=UPI001F2F6E22|nr:hypothetical protein [Vibrio sp. McD22-P3]MCF4175166.1 hypothetical protein [Vibrio sp. McD22-P3]
MKYAAALALTLLVNIARASEWSWESNNSLDDTYTTAQIATRINPDDGTKDLYISVASIETLDDTFERYVLFTNANNYASLCFKPEDFRQEVVLEIGNANIAYTRKCTPTSDFLRRGWTYYPSSKRAANAAITQFKYAKKWIRVQFPDDSSGNERFTYFDTTGFTRAFNKAKVIK